MTSTASGPDSAFLPDDALTCVPSVGSVGADLVRDSRPGHDAGPAQWLQHAMAIWLAPEGPGTDEPSDAQTPPGRSAPAH